MFRGSTVPRVYPHFLSGVAGEQASSHGRIKFDVGLVLLGSVGVWIPAR